ncbi:MAG: acyltransferase [Parafilimonas sp.]
MAAIILRFYFHNQNTKLEKIFLYRSKTVQQVIENEKFNNFKFMRLLAACMVIFYHSYAFTNEKNDPLKVITNGAISFSYLGLAIFFFLSGLLVTQSFYHSSSWRNFLWKRFLRLYPAAWLAILTCMFILGPLVTVFPFVKYFTNDLFFQYASSLSLVRVTYLLPGVFLHSPVDPSVNSPLWSISLELKLYLGLLIFAILRFPFKKTILVFLIIAAVFIEHFFYNATENAVKNFYNGFVLYPYVAYAPYFLIGVLYFIYHNKIVSNLFIALGALIITCISIKLNLFFLTRLIVIPILVLYASSLKPTLIKKITPKPDLSYGLYVFAYPVQQVISQITGTTNIAAWKMTLLCIICTLPFAFFSWYLVEKKALSFKRRMR